MCLLFLIACSQAGDFPVSEVVFSPFVSDGKNMRLINYWSQDLSEGCLKGTFNLAPMHVDHVSLR